MNYKNNELILQYQRDLRFNVSEQQAEFFLSNFQKYEGILAKITNFDFNKYDKYLYPSFDEKLTIPFNSLREDEPVEKLITQDDLFKNAVEFTDGYVVLKNEKQ